MAKGIIFLNVPKLQEYVKQDKMSAYDAAALLEMHRDVRKKAERKFYMLLFAYTAMIVAAIALVVL